MLPITCACGCQEQFRPWLRHQQYKRGHKPRVDVTVRPTTRVGIEADARASYHQALVHIQREIRLVEARIDNADDQIEDWRQVVTAARQNIEALYAAKDRECDHHAALLDAREKLTHATAVVEHVINSTLAEARA